MSKNLTARIIVAAVFGPLIIWMGYLGGWWLFGMVLLFATLGMLEFLWAERFRPKEPIFWIALLAELFLLGGVFIGDRYYTSYEPTAWLAVVAGTVMTGFFLISGMILATGREGARELYWKHARLIWGLSYIGLLYPFVFLLGDIKPAEAGYTFSGGDILLYLFGILWLGDTAAMAFGKWLGKRQLAPSVSPRKTVEGFIAGLIGAMVVGVIMIFWKFHSLEWRHVMMIAIGCSIFGQLGDLVESMWKRSLAIKDSSAVIPGHGGVLDRFDSLLFAAPFMYWYLVLVPMG